MINKDQCISQIQIGDKTYYIDARVVGGPSCTIYRIAKMTTTSFSWPANAVTKKIWNTGLGSLEGTELLGIIAISLTSGAQTDIKKLSLNSFGIEDASHGLVSFSLLNTTDSSIYANISFRLLYSIQTYIPMESVGLISTDSFNYSQNPLPGAGWEN